MMVMFATVCDVPGCKQRSPEYTQFASCLDCGEHRCPGHEWPGTHDEDEGGVTCLCAVCAAARILEDA